MNANGVAVFHGSVAEILVLQEALKANGIAAFAPDVEHLDVATLSAVRELAESPRRLTFVLVGSGSHERTAVRG